VAEAFLWGAAAASSLLLGGIAAIWLPIGRRLLGLIMAFGAGVLLSAVAYELVEEAFETSHGNREVALGLGIGAVAFFLGDAWIDHRGGAQRKGMAPQAGDGSGLAIVLGIVLDGIPESLVLGLTVLQVGEVSVALLVAVFLSNLPEAVAATSGLVQSGWERGRVLGLWVAMMLVSGLAALAGYGLFDSASPSTVAFVLAFAGGAVLTMLADTMMPEAFAHGGKLVGVVTTLGFGLAFAISIYE
jgi:zinc transporter, ZIP family